MMKFTKPFVLLSACASMMLMMSCGDTVVENNNGPISTEATLNVVVRDNSTGAVVNGATVTLLSAPGESIKSVVSSVTGTATFENTYVGNQKVLVEKTGYASMVYSTQIHRDNAGTGLGENVYIANENTIQALMYPLTSSLDGKLYYSKDNISAPAALAWVRITLDSNFVNRIDSVRTDATGYFKFDSLPAVGDSYQLTAMQYPVSGSGKIYQNTPFGGTKPSLTANAAEHITDKFEYINDITPFIYLGSSPVTVARTQALKLLFSDTIDAPNITRNPVTVTPEQPVTVTYKDDTLIITPKQEWRRDGGIIVTIDGGKLVSNKGNLLGNRAPAAPITVQIAVNVLSVDLSARAVRGLVIDTIPNKLHPYTSVSLPHYYSQLVNLKWEKIHGDSADYYEVFYKPDGKNSYEPAEFYITPDSLGDPTYMYATVYANGFNQLGSKTNTFVIQGVNDRSRSAFMVDSLSVRSVYSSPTLTAFAGGYSAVLKQVEDVGEGYRAFVTWKGSTISQTVFENWLYVALLSTTGTSEKHTLIFTEEMDTTANLIGNQGGTAWISDRVTVTKEWRDENNSASNTKLTVTVNVAPAATPVAPNTTSVYTYTFSGLRSKNGKSFFIEYYGSDGLPAKFNKTKDVRSTLDFKIKATLP